MTENEKLLIQLRDCFTAGYTLPQFCVDNEIKKPLIVGIDNSQQNFLWELYIQFHYDKRISVQPQFAFIKGNISSINFATAGISLVNNLEIKNIADFNVDDFDKFIMLITSIGHEKHDKIIYLDELTKSFNNRAYGEIPLLHFLQNNPGVKCIVLNSPRIVLNPYTTEREKKILLERKNGVVWGSLSRKLRESGESFESPYDFLGYSNKEVLELLEAPLVETNTDGSTSLKGVKNNKFMSVYGGKRLTANQPDKYKNKIYFVGRCGYYGFGVPFDKTVESCLQKILNENNFPYRVENEGQYLNGRYQDIFYNLKNLPLKDGDIIFISPYSNDSIGGLPFLDTMSIFVRPHNYGEVFAEPGHMNELGHKFLADYIFKVLLSNNFFKDMDFKYPPAPPPIHRYGIPKENSISPASFSQNKELEEYKAKLREKRFQVGAIVMNCNPFTLGHEYLIEYASKKVKKLYIFVVEEDKSEFKFTDRFELVKRGVKKFSNVEVLPSGKFIISQQTFSGYFNKENLQDVAVDSSQDVEIFAREIAPSLGITVRFVGEEPEDSVTRQYNENMRNILPQYNIEFCEIPRREIGGEVISAKKVREALKIGDFDTIKKLVPKTTLKFLRDNFSK